MQNIFAPWGYIPILSISPAEMTALEELPGRDIDQLLPLFALKGWAAANKLESTLKRIEKSVGNRQWIADIDENFLSKNKTFLFTGKYPDKEIYKEIQALLDPSDGYSNWCGFIESRSNLIPCMQHGEKEGFAVQAARLYSLGRGVVLRIRPEESNISKHSQILEILHMLGVKDVLFLYDLGTIDVNFAERIGLLNRFIVEARAAVREAAFSVSASSFPNSFSGQLEGEKSIYERLLFNIVEASGIAEPLIYSDRGSARAEKQKGGSGTPPPRIDYPLKKDWKFVRREIDDNAPNSKEKRKSAYIEMAKEVVEADYWISSLRLWGTQQIELTALGDDFSINSAQKSTAVRINIHLFNQLHYSQDTTDINTDEEWVD